MNAAALYRLAFSQMPRRGDHAFGVAPEIDSGPLNADDPEERYRPSLRLMHEAAAVARCDWGVSPQGPFSHRRNYEHHEHAVRLAGAALDRAAGASKNGRHEACVNDLLAVMMFGRHVAADGTVPGKQFEYSIDDRVVRHAAHVLHGMPVAAAELLLQRLDGLPASTPFVEALRNEKRWALAWLRHAAATTDGVERFARELEAQQHWQAPFRAVCVAEWRDGVRREKALANLEWLHDEMIRIVESPPHNRWDEFASRYWERQRSFGGLAHALAPVMGLATVEPEAQARLALLKAAVAVRVRGADALPARPDPFGNVAFGYRRTSGGFVLRSVLTRADRPIELAVERPQHELQPPDDD